jgi:hypothetical protein
MITGEDPAFRVPRCRIAAGTLGTSRPGAHLGLFFLPKSQYCAPCGVRASALLHVLVTSAMSRSRRTRVGVPGLSS